MEKKIRALCLSGGGSRGAVQVGVLLYLLQHDPEIAKAWYRAFCGVSVGNINCAFLAQYTTKESIMGLVNLWKSLSDDQVKKRWFPFGRLHGLWETGLYSTKPLRQTIEKHFDAERMKRTGNKLRLGAVNLNTLEYKLFTEQDDDLVSAILGSAAFPGMLPAIDIDGQSYVDGGVRTVTPLKAAIDIDNVEEVDVILATHLPGKKNKKTPKNAIDVLLHSLESIMDEVTVNDIKMAVLYNKLIELGAPGYEHKKKIKIRMFQPQGAMPGEPLDFDHEPIMEMIERGYEAGRNPIEL